MKKKNISIVIIIIMCIFFEIMYHIKIVDADSSMVTSGIRSEFA